MVIRKPRTIFLEFVAMVKLISYYCDFMESELTRRLIEKLISYYCDFMESELTRRLIEPVKKL